jgi:uncharacterized protein (UPF0216 family)
MDTIIVQLTLEQLKTLRDLLQEEHSDVIDGSTTYANRDEALADLTAIRVTLESAVRRAGIAI